MKRWVLQLGAFSIRLHRWLASDDDRHLHDHPWWFLTLVLRGGYVDVHEAGGERWADRLRAGSVRLRPARHRHTVQVDPGGAWTLLLTGPHSRDWGFWVDGEWKRMRRYFREHGHHPCEEAGRG